MNLEQLREEISNIIMEQCDEYARFLRTGKPCKDYANEGANRILSIPIGGEVMDKCCDGSSVCRGGGFMTPELQKKMQDLMYMLTKNAARFSYREFLENLEISEKDYEIIKAEWKDKFGVIPYV